MGDFDLTWEWRRRAAIANTAAEECSCEFCPVHRSEPDDEEETDDAR